MTDQHLDPPRMFESDAVPSELRQWLVLANQDVLSAPQIEQLASALERKAQAEGIGSSHPLSTPDGVNPWFKSSAGKLGLIAVAIGLGAAGASSFVVPASRSASPASGFPSKPDVATLQETTSESHVVRAAANASAAPPESRAGDGTHVARSVASSAHSSAPAPSKSPLSNGTGSGEIADSADEYRLVRAARQAAASDAARGLALTEEHARRFPSGMLSQERETIAIECLVRLGNRALAQQRAKRFFVAFPTSPYATRIRSAVSP